MALWRDMGSAEFKRQRRAITQKDLHARAGAVYEMDSTAMDVFIRVEQPDGSFRALRPWLTVVEDVASRAVVGYHVTLGSVSSESVFSAWLHALSPCEGLQGLFGQPEEVRIDRGSEYTQEFRDIVQASGTMVTVGPPGQPDVRGKVERFLGNVATWCRELPGCTDVVGGDPERAQPIVDSLYTVAMLQIWLGVRLREYNTTRIHTSLGTTPMAKWNAAARPVMPSDDVLLAFMPNQRETSVCHGLLTIQERYRKYAFHVPAELNLIDETVTARWRDLEEGLHLYDRRGGRHLGFAPAVAGATDDEAVTRLFEDRALAAARRREAGLVGALATIATSSAAEDTVPPEAGSGEPLRASSRAGDASLEALRAPIPPAVEPQGLDEQARRMLEFLRNGEG